MVENLASNLQLLCSYYKSVADVCRRLNINRAQFNRYLNSTTVPSNSTLRRIGEFFGVEPAEMMLSSAEFAQLVQSRPIRLNDDITTVSPEQQQFNVLNESGQHGLSKYCGYYFEYYFSMACPGKILRTLVHIESQGDKTYYQRTERLNPRNAKKSFHGIYRGVVQLLSDRLFLIDYEVQTHVEMTQTILYPSFRNRVERLTGLRLGVSGSGERAPCCVRVVYEYLGKNINKQRAVAQCGLYDINDDELDEDICQSITNDMNEGDWHFRARF
ncbi:transcriptional regulator [Marinomonas pontica]|uniref:Transcriptional regulator n=1 Tax=Marinomonas pontica TaxID=264739 RepID=A0ABN6WQ49_9GAMM|nr:transcriptional regulator [Marinomonas pontica]